MGNSNSNSGFEFRRRLPSKESGLSSRLDSQNIAQNMCRDKHDSERFDLGTTNIPKERLIEVSEFKVNSNRSSAAKTPVPKGNVLSQSSSPSYVFYDIQLFDRR